MQVEETRQDIEKPFAQNGYFFRRTKLLIYQRIRICRKENV